MNGTTSSAKVKAQAKKRTPAPREESPRSGQGKPLDGRAAPEALPGHEGIPQTQDGRRSHSYHSRLTPRVRSPKPDPFLRYPPYFPALSNSPNKPPLYRTFFMFLISKRYTTRKVCWCIGI